ncbi:MFS transporter [Cohnella caldifontis]|uniref:MFS transporter n=1 Tax=Cohnella caldifontis TaxID=3027471 RepID=UPI0023ED2091|nr:MFS transporter [Cohnella sp. YIM B05605]
MDWKRTLWVLWVANLIFSTGISLFLPFLPFYIQELGVRDTDDVVRWSGWIFTSQSVTAVLFQPLWGSIADKRGHKGMLLRSGIGMAVMTILMGFAAAPWQLLVLRLLNGVLSGFIAMSVSFQASITPEKHAGKALGLMQTGQTAGMLIGPLLGGGIAELLGFRQVFLLTGVLSLLATLCVGVFVNNRPVETNRDSDAPRKPVPGSAGWKPLIPLLPVFAVTAVTQLGMMSIQPIVTVYTQMIYGGSHVTVIAGLVVAMTGIGNLIGSPFVGRIGDRIGHRKMLVLLLFLAGISLLPQALFSSLWILLVCRFFLGLFVGGATTSLSVLVKRLAPKDTVSRAFGFSASSRFLGNFAGPLIGSAVAASFGFREVFAVTSAVFLLNGAFLVLYRGMGTVPERGRFRRPS